MPVHDWTRVYSGTFHAVHVSWIARLQDALNSGLLPDGYYALAEQHAGQMVPDVLTLAEARSEQIPAEPRGATALAEAPPQVSVRMSIDEETTYRTMRRTLAIRHRTGRRLVAMIEIVSPGNKDSEAHLEQFVEKSVAARSSGIHLLVVDLQPPGPWDRQGIHAAVWDVVGGGSFELPENKPLSLASYMADLMPEAFVEPVAVGDRLPDMPIFLSLGWYVPVPLEATYSAAYDALPAIVRDVLEGRSPPEWENA